MPCPTCREDISKRACVCPKCGEPDPFHRIRNWNILVFIFVISVLSGISFAAWRYLWPHIVQMMSRSAGA